MREIKRDARAADAHSAVIILGSYYITFVFPLEIFIARPLRAIDRFSLGSAPPADTIIIVKIIVTVTVIRPGKDDNNGHRTDFGRRR